MSEPRAEGGPVSAGRPYLVGERGPELFVPMSHTVKIDGRVVADAMRDGQRRHRHILDRQWSDGLPVRRGPSLFERLARKVRRFLRRGRRRPQHRR